jgi:iron complex outermembrane receptor protein
VYGLEAALRAEPVDGLVLNGRFAWLESVFLDFTNESIVLTDGGVGPGGIPISSQLSKVADFSGNRLINSPQFKASGSVMYTLDMGRFGQLIPFYDFSWSDDIFFDASAGEGQPNFAGETEFPKNAIGQRAFWLHNLRLTYRLPNGQMEISAWVRNLTDEVYKTYAFDASTFSNVTLHFPGLPRTYGGSINLSW